MNSKNFLIKLQFLGFRYHGVQKQKEYLSIQEKIEKCIQSSLGEISFKTRFSSRTDSMVSALETYCLLMFESMESLEQTRASLCNLAADIKILEVRAVDEKFSLLKSAVIKEYHYFFSFGEVSNHPFSSPFMTHIKEQLDIELMMKGASEFVGSHNFVNYVFKPKTESQFQRSIISCQIVENDFFLASFFPEKSYVLKISAHGFMRGQVRLITGALFRLGMKAITIQELRDSLIKADTSFVKWKAPAAGLILHKTKLD